MDSDVAKLSSSVGCSRGLRFIGSAGKSAQPDPSPADRIRKLALERTAHGDDLVLIAQIAIAAGASWMINSLVLHPVVPPFSGALVPLLAMERDYANKLNTYKPEWPAMIELKGKIEQAQRNLKTVAANAVKAVQSS